MRVRWKRFRVGFAVAAALALVCFAWCKQHHDGGGGPPDDEHARQCRANHPPFVTQKLGRGSGAFPRQPMDGVKAGILPLLSAPLVLAASAAPDGMLFDNCPTCGLNGTWLGSGVPFRTLHVSPYRHNDINLSVIDFRGPHDEPLKLRVDRDRLHAASNDLVEAGSVLYLGAPESPGGLPTKRAYAIQIIGVDTKSQDFWIDCPSCSNQKVPLYQFTAKSLSDDCDLEVCKPGLDDGQLNSVQGTAVIFRGDFYDNSYTVSGKPPSDYDDDVFNIACLGTAISKLHLFRHTAASQATASDPAPPSVDKRQTILRLLTADYCGAGQPFTHDGVPINIGIDSALGPTSGSGFLLGTGGVSSIDAFWNSEGATCLGTPRLQSTDPSTRNRVVDLCQSLGHPLPDCSTLVPADKPFQRPFPAGSYATSQIPQP